MERLKTQAYIVAGMALAFGLFVNLMPRAKYEKKTEEQMEKMAPDIVAGASFLPGSPNPEQTYKMDERSYQVLNPFGMVARKYAAGPHLYDVVLIASNDRGSFHDPRVCFSAGGYELANQTVIEVPTKTRGIVPVSYTTLRGSQGQAEMIAAYTYRGPYGFTAAPQTLKIGILRAEMLLRTDLDAVFYRFMADSRSTTKEELLKFIGDYLDAANASSEGYF